MKRVRQVLVILIAVGVGCWLAWRAWGPHPEDRTVLSGYIESETLNLSAPVSGFIARLDVARGDRVAAGQALFAMDDASLCAQRDQAAANLAQAQAQIAVAQAKLAQSRSSASAKAQSAAQQAALADIAARLAQLTPQAPAGARVQDVFYQKGEWAADNQPVVSLLPDDKVKLRFFVPETQVTRYRPGETVHFDCDGCAPGLTARISYVSAQPEYTPPIIYSRNTRDRLVFLVEALPADGRNLPPGLPVDVTPLP
jgi:HlyD family secretion protein